MKNKPLVITASVATLIVVAAAAVLVVLTSLAGQKSGLQKSGHTRCVPHLTASAVRDVTSPDYGARIAELARCGR